MKVFRIIVLSTIAVTGCVSKNENWYKAGASQQDFYITRQHCDNESVNGPARSSFVGTMLQQSIIFDTCMKNNGYVKVDSPQSPPVTQPPAGTSSALANQSLENPAFNAAYCLGVYTGASLLFDQLSQKIDQTKTDPDSQALKVIIQNANISAIGSISEYHAYLMKKGITVDTTPNTPPDIKAKFEQGANDGHLVSLEMVKQEGPLACVNTCGPVDPANPGKHDDCTKACGPLTPEEVRVAACPDHPPSL